MKNIHLLPTEKPSRLSFDFDEDEYLLTDELVLFDNQNLLENRHIYITSEKDIKDNDWIITKDGRLIQVSYLLSKELDNASKIILTTDQDLIKDGIQEIDDEFLEWFVNNSKCEFIEVIDKLRYFNIDELRERHLNGLAHIYYEKIGYQIIIPKEIQKQHLIDMMKTDEEIGLYEELKQETLEEAAENYGWRIKRNTFSDTVKANELAESAKQDFIAGAKWQQEQDKNVYTEEQVKMLMFNFYYDMSHKMNVPKNLISENATNVDEWFKEVKHK